MALLIIINYILAVTIFPLLLSVREKFLIPGCCGKGSCEQRFGMSFVRYEDPFVRHERTLTLFLLNLYPLNLIQVFVWPYLTKREDTSCFDARITACICIVML